MAVEVGQATGRFVQDWFDLLSRHAPVATLLPFVADVGLEMMFPERTLHSHADFVNWYADVGANYTDQDHVVEDLSTVADGDFIDIELTVVWRATKTADGSRLAARVRQSWRLASGAQPVIVNYQVLTMDPI
jgi:hypothetical protein